MAEFPPDVPPLELPEAGRLTAVDFMSLRLPVALVGYHTQTVDETLRRVATALSERDTRIAILEQQIAELRGTRLPARQEAYAGGARPPHTEHLPRPPQGEPTELHTPATAARDATRPLTPPEGADAVATPPTGEQAVRNGTARQEPTEDLPAAPDAPDEAAKDAAAQGEPKEDPAAEASAPQDAARQDPGERDAGEKDAGKPGAAGKASEEKGSGRPGAGKGAAKAAVADPLEGEEDW
ncbi:hypothetical protein FHX40_0390 [Thermopolyspora flexuosa]|jgi:hypothetical protein|uniref:DivIVA domain-containing protein n=2 Tax=Thermopolyspora flexuosa TaxID=103836 RepID=A0A543IT53_9ACTN|nr:hypothetical protein FHX40_0390 [Thermopolyspora flexuosa]